MAHRPDLYRDVHKGIRALLFALLDRAGRTDFSDVAAVVSLRTFAREGFDLLESHAAHESETLHPVVALHAPQLGGRLDADHEDQHARMHELTLALDAVDSAEDRLARGAAFCLSLSRLTGELLVHMADEEQVAMPALWAALDDEALIALHQRILAGISPAETMAFLGWMLPAMAPADRLDLLSGMRRGAPPEVFAAVYELARRVLPLPDWARLEHGLAAAA